MTELVLNAIYRIKLCSDDEIRQWQYLGPDSRSLIWWRDVETGAEFNESSLMYAWEIVPDEEAPLTNKDRNS
ncbi:MAG TPA: hypothetical protein VFK88_08895 [Gallionella sp.]|nr:hypothetical protein [Gallionella sp.]